MVQTRARRRAAQQRNNSEVEEMNSSRLSRKHDSDEDDVDPTMYKIFQKMMAKMMPEQAEANSKKISSKTKVKRKPVKKHVRISKKKIKQDSTSEGTESGGEDSEEEQFVFVPKHLRQVKKVAEEPESVNKPKDGVPAEDSVQILTKMVKDLQIRDKGKRVYTRQDFYLGLDGDNSLEDLSRKFIKFDGSGNPKAHLAMFFAECARFSEDNRALFLCFPRSLEGVAAKWYAENINPGELQNFDKVVNLFVERFMFNTEALPTLNHLYNLKQGDKKKVVDFIRRWRDTCNKMRTPISEEHQLQVILNNFSQPLRSLISTYPSKSFIELIERAEWLEMGMDNGNYEGITLVKGGQDLKRKVNYTFSANSGGSGSKDNKTKQMGQQKEPFKQNDKPVLAKQKEKIKREGWGYDRQFSALEQSLEQILEYMLSKDMIKLPRVADPPVSLGKWKDKFCKFHRAVGHDTEHCFVLKNIIQDCIDKNLLIEDEEEEQPAILTKPFPDHSKNW